MKKIIFVSAFLFCISTNAQYFMYGFNNVPENEVEHYIQNEKELFSKAAQKAFKKGVISGWTIMKRVQGAKSEPNFYWYLAVDDIKKLDNLSTDFGKIVNETIQASGVPSLVNRALKNHNSYTMWVGTYYRPEIITRKNSDGFIYFKHNVAMSPNPNQWLDTQLEEWGAFIKKNMDNGKVKQEIWAPAIRLTPLGNGYNWNVISVDGFNTLEDLYTNRGLDYPDMSSIDSKALQNSMPEGWHKQIIWERIMWLDADGEIKTR
ncbi:hypothetical protein N9R15_00025 [Flavobacteriaceae bacterium]|nr:hypothetical protein [Flavobacteriaceae bacterium]MDC1522769.1 hypothetical protein [Flavobacteriaceae bacterium]